MDTRDTIELGALLSANSILLVESPIEPPPEGLRRAWRHCRDRVGDWLNRLHDLSDPDGAPSDPHAAAEVAREMLTSDVLVRVWIGLLAARARTSFNDDLEAISRNLLLGRLRARRFVLRWLLDDSLLPESLLASVDRLRRRAERWTDMLLAPLVSRFDLDDLAFDPQRSRDFAREELAESAADPTGHVWQLLLTGIRVAFQDLVDDDATRTANRELVSAVLGCLPEDAFHRDGTFRSLSVARIRRDPPPRSSQPPGTDLLLSLLQPRFGDGTN